MLTGLAPVVAPTTRLLVLGSFPGVASLAAQQYYGHPQNHFWRLLFAVFEAKSVDSPRVDCHSSYQIRTDWLLARGVGLWDVYASCEREGSLDSQIRCVRINDFSTLRQRCPVLQAIAHNGGESFKHARHVTQALGLPVHKLPSTSPANATWRFERKLTAWREVFQQHGLV
jgi:hypoxanthine-DNA glycosylase